MVESKQNISFKTIALADDDSDDTDLFGEAILGIDPKITLEIASNGRELLNKMRSGEFALPDVIFLDINMPEMNGWQCLEALKKDNLLKPVPVVIYSTSSHVQDKKLATALGASLFITKPDDFQQLKQTLARLINDPGTFMSSTNS